VPAVNSGPDLTNFFSAIENGHDLVTSQDHARSLELLEEANVESPFKVLMMMPPSGKDFLDLGDDGQQPPCCRGEYNLPPTTSHQELICSLMIVFGCSWVETVVGTHQVDLLAEGLARRCPSATAPAGSACPGSDGSGVENIFRTFLTLILNGVRRACGFSASYTGQQRLNGFAEVQPTKDNVDAVGIDQFWDFSGEGGPV